MFSKTLIAALLVAGTVPMLPTPVTTLTNGEDVATWVRARIKALQPTPEEKRFDTIGWARGIVQAEGLARQYKRPVFLFAYNGNIDTGRC